LKEGVVFHSVSFTYPGTDKIVLQDINLHISPGEVVAIVGENGAGKTTLAKLLTRLYDPTAGSITVDGIDIRRFDVDAWRRQIGMLFQDFVRYQLPARENIGVGNVDRLEDDARIEESALKSGIHEVISNLPQGYDTMLGRMFKQGHELSIGEWQKVALARAFMRQSLVIILDEPSAALDAHSERELFERFKDLTSGLTAIFVSHRFSTVRQADRIVVLNAGRIVELGSHTKLMQLGGLYAHMFRLQSEMYT
jgi:ATP-binding cassette subfamily B protein